MTRSDEVPGRRPTAVLAGCGRLGTGVGLRLRASGYRVLGLRRDADRVPDCFEAQAVDLSSQRPGLPADTSVVIAALTADERTVESYRRTYLGALHHLLAEVEESFLVRPRIVWVSSTAVFDIDDGSWVDEDTAAAPVAGTAQVLREAEQFLHHRDPDAVVVRLAGLYGEGTSRLVNRIRVGELGGQDGRRYSNRIHRVDAARAIMHLATSVERPSPVYVGTDDEPVERGTLVRFLADLLGVPPPVVVTEPPTGAIGGKRCANVRLKASGFSFDYPTYREGYRQLVHHEGPPGPVTC